MKLLFKQNNNDLSNKNFKMFLMIRKNLNTTFYNKFLTK